MRLRGQRFKAGSLHWAPSHRRSCPRHQCSRLEKPQGQQWRTGVEREDKIKVKHEQEKLKNILRDYRDKVMMNDC